MLQWHTRRVRIPVFDTLPGFWKLDSHAIKADDGRVLELFDDLHLHLDLPERLRESLPASLSGTAAFFEVGPGHAQAGALTLLPPGLTYLTATLEPW